MQSLISPWVAPAGAQTAAPSPGPSPVPSSAPLPPAGVIPGEVTVELGGSVSPRFASDRIALEIARVTQLQAGATVAIGGVTIARQLVPDDELEAVAAVRLEGHGFASDVTGTTSVHVRVESLAQLDPAFLFYSDDPEKIDAGGTGVLYRGTIALDRTARLYAYHVASLPDTHLSLVLQTASGAARVQVLGYAAGPADAYAYVGHLATLQYLLERATQESAIVPVVAGAPYVMALGRGVMHPNDLVTAVFDLRVLAGEPVEVDVVATLGNADPATSPAGPDAPGDGHGRRGTFSLGAVPPLALAFTAGAAEPAPFSAGVKGLVNLEPGGRPLGGDYGVLRSLSLQLSNPLAQAQDVYLYESPAGGSSTTTIWFAGDEHPTEFPCVRGSAARYIVKQFTLGPGEKRAVGGEFMTDGASSFPLLFGVSAEPPSPPPGPSSPDACNPKPLPSATPAPAASPAPSPAAT